MKTFPLIRVKWSNEHIMAALFFVLALYHLPRWSKNPSDILSFLILIAVGLILDSVMNRIRLKRFWCSVSAAVTAAMLSVLTFGVPLWGRLLGVVIALVLGKHLWGGMGKNIFNPAMVGMLFILLIFPVTYPFFESSFLLLPAIILSIPFLKMRPSVSRALLGLMVVITITGEVTWESVLTSGIFFWGCLVLTDPVTVTLHPSICNITIFMVGFFVYALHPTAWSIVMGILIVNLISYLTDNFATKIFHKGKRRLRISKVVPNREDKRYIDLTDKKMLRWRKDWREPI